MPNDDLDGFQFVSHKKKSKRPCQITPAQETSLNEISSFNQETCIRRIQEAKEDISTSALFESIKASLREGLQLLKGQEISGIVCFGLGRFTECMTSRYQVALLLLLKDLYTTQASTYDPVFSSNELEVLKHYNIQIIEENTEGKYRCNSVNSNAGIHESLNIQGEKSASVSNISNLTAYPIGRSKDDLIEESENSNDKCRENITSIPPVNTNFKRNDTTIFFLPHCPKQLSNNLLWANWGLDLSRCVIIANSFNRILEANTKRVVTDNAGYLLKISPYVKELAVINSFRYYEIFNDTAIHIFPRDELALVSSDFWEDNEEPVYVTEDVEFVRKLL